MFQRIQVRITFALVLLSAAFFSAFGQEARAQNATAPKTVTVTDTDNNGEFNLNPGDTLVVRLSSNHTTGYSWQVAQNDASLLRPLGNRYVRSRTKLMGAPGFQVFRFKAVGSGGTQLILFYQAQTRGVQAAKKFQILATIKRRG